MDLNKLKYKYRKLDKIRNGLIAGIIGPWIGFCLYYLIKFSHHSFAWYWHMYFNTKEYQAPILTLSLIFNAFMLYPALQLDYYKLGRGIILATFIYSPLVIYLYFF